MVTCFRVLPSLSSLPSRDQYDEWRAVHSMVRNDDKNNSIIRMEKSDRNNENNQGNNNNNNNNNRKRTPPKESKKGRRSQRWIVLVDDEAAIRDAVGRFLLESGYQVTTCTNGMDALRVALNGQPVVPVEAPPSSSSSFLQPQQQQRMKQLSTSSKTTTKEMDNTDPANSDNTVSSSSVIAHIIPTMTTEFPTYQGTLVAPRAIPDAIVSDIRMPIMDGITLLEQIRSHPQLVPIPVILLTAKGMTNDRIAGYQAGADAYVPKPFDPDELLAIIDHCISRHEALNESNHQNVITDLQQTVQEIRQYILQQNASPTPPLPPPPPPLLPLLPSTSSATTATASTTTRIPGPVFLAPDERQVLELLSLGYQNSEIGQQMYLSTRRIEQLITILFRKTQVKNRTELVRWAISTGMVKI
jgi:DNA-binding NarL/FixJ family response regulator